MMLSTFQRLHHHGFISLHQFCKALKLNGFFSFSIFLGHEIFSWPKIKSQSQVLLWRWWIFWKFVHNFIALSNVDRRAITVTVDWADFFWNNFLCYVCVMSKWFILQFDEALKWLFILAAKKTCHVCNNMPFKDKYQPLEIEKTW